MRTPTIIKVVVKADSTIYSTPFSNRIPHRGKEIKPGIIVMEPKKEAMRTPVILPLFPSVFEMTVSGMKNRTIETRVSILKRADKMDILLRTLAFS